jgi:ElaA protein
MASPGQERAEDPGLSFAWRFARFEELEPREVHDLYQARIAVFVLEQDCPFQDLDGVDPQCWHLIGYSAEGAVQAYCRIVPPGVKYPEPSIGRVLTTAPVRRTGAGRVLMREAIARLEALWPGLAIRIGAQARLEAFYRDFGFETSSAPYDEDGIVHVEMTRGARTR